MPGVQQVRPECEKCFLGVASVGRPKSVAYPNFARNMAKVWMVWPKSQQSVAKVCPVWPECGHGLRGMSIPLNIPTLCPHSATLCTHFGHTGHTGPTLCHTAKKMQPIVWNFGLLPTLSHTFGTLWSHWAHFWHWPGRNMRCGGRSAQQPNHPALYQADALQGL